MTSSAHAKYLSKLPVNWERVPVRALGTVHAGGTPSRDIPRYWNGTIHWVTPAEITKLESKYLSKTNECITYEGLACCSTKLLPEGSLIVTTRATIGGVAVSKLPVCTNQGFKNIVLNEMSNVDFYYHLFSIIVPELSRLASGSTFPEISQRNFESIIVPRPSKEEQRRIAKILDTIDETIQKTEALISKLKAMKQGLLHDLLTRGLGKNGKLRDPQSYLIPFSGVVQVNPKTDMYGLNDSTNVSFIPMSDVSESGHWIIRQTRSLRDVRNGYTCFKENDVLFAKITPCMENGKGGHAIGLVNGIGFGTTEFHVLRAGPEIEPRYIYYWTMTEGLRRKAEAQMTGSAGQRRVPAEFFDNFKIPLFPHSEQRKIVKILDAHDARIRTEEQYRDKLKLQKKGLMHDLLTGKVRVKSKDNIIAC